MTPASRSTATSSCSPAQVAERQPQLVGARAARVERAAGHVGDARLRGRGAQLHGVEPLGQREPGEEAAVGGGPAAAVREVALERALQRAPVRGVQLARGRQVALEVPGAAVLLEHPLAERAGALVRRLLRGGQLLDQLRRADRPAEPHAGEEHLGERAGLHDDVRRQRPQRRQRRPVERQLAVGDVLEDEHAVAAAGLHERLAAVERQRPARRVLELRDHVEELRPQPGGQPLLERVDDQAVGVHRDLVHVRLGARERQQRAQVGRRLDGDRVARVHERPAREREALHPAARHDQLGALRPPPLELLLAVEQVLAHAREALARRVLERDGRVVADHAGGDLVEHAGRERGRVREPAGHRQHAGRAAREDRGQLRAVAVARAACEEVSGRQHRS